MQLTDKRLAELADRYHALRAQAKAAEAEAKDICVQVAAELERRGASEVVHGTARHIVVRRSTTIYDLEAAKARLRPGVWRAVTRTVIDPEAWKQAVAAAKVTPADVAGICSLKPSAPYLTRKAAA